MTGAKELKEWINSLPDDDGVAVSEGGLILVARSGAYFELGGVPEEESLDEWPAVARW